MLFAHTFVAPVGRITSDFSRDGRWLAASDGTVWLFDTRSWKKKHFDLSMTTNVVFSPDSRFVMASQWDIGIAYSLVFVNSVKVQEIKGETQGAPLFSRDGHTMVLTLLDPSREGNATVQLWDVPHLRLKRKLAAPNEEFWSNALSPDARFLVGQSNNGERNRVIVQRLSDGKTLFSLTQNPDSIRWLDSRTLELKSGKTTKRIRVPAAK